MSKRVVGKEERIDAFFSFQSTPATCDSTIRQTTKDESVKGNPRQTNDATLFPFLGNVIGKW